MNWSFGISKNAEQFLQKHKRTADEMRGLMSKAIQYFRGEDINIDIRKMKGEWAGFYRIRSGRMRIIAGFDFENSAIFIEEIDWRGNIY